MKITFIAPGIGMYGGIRVIFEYANHLCAQGHNVSVIYPLIPMRLGAKWYNLRTLLRRGLGFAANIKQGVHVNWFDLKANLIRVPSFAERYIPNADIIVATMWETAYYVSKFSKDKGVKFYLIQHYETWTGPEKEVNNTYRLGLRNIVISTWLKHILQDKLNAPVEAVVLNAVNLDQFYPSNGERSNDTVRILIPYRREKWKGIEDGVKAFEYARQRHPNIQLVMFGLGLGRGIPRYAEFHRRPYGDRLRQVYNSCDIFVFPSHCEGFGLPPMEAMACKCAVVSTNVGGIPDFTIPGETALLSPPHHPELLADNIIRLVEDKELRRHISEAGYEHIRNFTWDKATDALEQTFHKALNGTVE